MCGIVGATGRPDVAELLVEGLERLEYRGYDSAGIVLAVEGALWRTRAADGTRSVAALTEALAAMRPGQTVTLQVERPDGSKGTVRVRLGQFPGHA